MDKFKFVDLLARNMLDPEIEFPPDEQFSEEDENYACKKCGRKDLPLFWDYRCPECHEE